MRYDLEQVYQTQGKITSVYWIKHFLIVIIGDLVATFSTILNAGDSGLLASSLYLENGMKG